MIKLLLVSIISLLATLSFSSSAMAQNKKKKKDIKINFEDELIQGDIKKPELFYLLQRKQFNFKRMIHLRENFLPEMNATGKTIGRGGGK